jgi:hypothetical protein
MLHSIIGIPDLLRVQYAAAAPGGGVDAVGRAARVTRGLTGGGGGGKSREHWVQDRNIMLCQQPSCRLASKPWNPNPKSRENWARVRNMM